jgi:Carboxypeptidase regulatory-like domain
MMGIVTVLAAYFTIGMLPMDLNPLQGDVMVRGTVVEADNSHGVAGATVFAASAADVQAVTADDQGRFYFLKLLPGNYQFSAVKPGYTGECTWRGNDPQVLNAGFEYLATVILLRAC